MSQGHARVPEHSPLVQLLNVHKTYSKLNVPIHAVRGVSLTIAAGEFIAIVGASGSGKTTLMNILGCLDTLDRGSYTLAGTNVGSSSRDELADLRNSTIGFVFQGFNLLSRATVLENVQLPMICSRQRMKPQHMRTQALERLSDVGLYRYAERFPSQLSGGEQQRVAIARALANQPKLILADEPTGNLDSLTALQIMEILQSLNAAGSTLVMVTHDPCLPRFCSRALTVKDGAVVADKPTIERLSARDELRTAEAR